jgi:hypothetical protein
MAGIGRPLEEIDVPEPAHVPDYVPAEDPKPSTPRR